jgi:hypothetical protein
MSAMEILAAVTVAAVMVWLAIPWVGGAIRDSRSRRQREDWAERDRKRELEEAIRREQEAFAEDLLCAELDLVIADVADASQHLQAVLAEADR